MRKFDYQLTNWILLEDLLFAEDQIKKYEGECYGKVYTIKNDGTGRSAIFTKGDLQTKDYE